MTVDSRGIKIVITGRFPGMNEIIERNRGSWQRGARTKYVSTEWCRAHFLNYLRTGGHPVNRKVDLYITWYERDHRRDHDNVLSGGLKSILDGAVQARFLPDDSQKYVGDIHSHIEVDKGNERVEIEFREVRDEG